MTDVSVNQSRFAKQYPGQHKRTGECSRCDKPRAPSSRYCNSCHAREYQLSVIASEVRQWIKENPDSPHISVFGRSKKMFEAWLDCLDNAAADLLAAAREEGVNTAIAFVEEHQVSIDDDSYRVVMAALQAARISSLKPKTTDEAKS